jgi:hypothetical protein
MCIPLPAVLLFSALMASIIFGFSSLPVRSLKVIQSASEPSSRSRLRKVCQSEHKEMPKMKVESLHKQHLRMRNGPELGADMVFENLDCEVGNGTNARDVGNVGMPPICPGRLGVDRLLDRYG